MRILFTFFFLLGALCLPIRAVTQDETTQDERVLTSLEQQASQVNTDSQCYVYARLVDKMVEYSTRQYAAGNVKGATSMLKRSQEFVRKIRALMTVDSKRLKRSQMLLSRTVFRLTELLRDCNYQDAPLVQETLSQVSQAEADLMIQVFNQ